MSDTSTLSFPEAARHLGVSVRVLRQAIRAGKIPGPEHLAATVRLTPEWLASVKSAVAASPKLFSAVLRQKVPAFARYEGTSAWRKYRHRVRAYYRFKDAAASGA